MKPITRIPLSLFVILALLCLGAQPALAGNVRSKGRSDVSSKKSPGPGKNVNVNQNKNVNVNSHRDVDVDIDVDHHHHGGYYGGCCYHDPNPWATAAAVMVTAVVVGSIVNTLPSGCQTVIINGFAYQQCGNTWYQPQMSGSSTTYIVVNPPR